jgi:hypothetical protein
MSEYGIKKALWCYKNGTPQQFLCAIYALNETDLKEFNRRLEKQEERRIKKLEG